MTKFYVMSGHLTMVVNAPTAKEAVRIALTTCTVPVKLAAKIWVNERGFEHEDIEQDIFFETMDFIKPNS